MPSRQLPALVFQFCLAFFLFLSTTNTDMNMADAFGQPPPPTTANPNPTPGQQQASGITAPTHLAVLVHGFVGRPDDLTYLQSSITKFGKGKVLAHTASCNLGKTHDGVKAGGERLAEEVRQLVAANPSLQGISFVGNSLGGLYSRYALSLLWAPEKKTIALLRPVTFMTVASPHLGVRKFTMVPLPDKSHFIAPLFLGQTGNDLFLRRPKKEGSDGAAAAASDADAAATTTSSTPEEQSQTTTPLLLRMAQEPRFLDPLAAFEHRRAYGNVREDMLVPMGTSLFHPVGPLAPTHTLRETLVLPDPITSHATLEIFHLAPEGRSGVAAGVSSLTNALSSSSSGGGGGNVGGLMASDDDPGQDWMEPFMAQRLNALGWEKVAVDFKFAFLNAHNMICSLSRDRVTSFLFKKGRSVMDHAAKNLVMNAERAQKASP